MNSDYYISSSSSDNLRKAYSDKQRNETYRLWVTQRKETLLDKVSAQDVLRHFGVTLKYGGSDREEQICCPFHGDKDPSARVFGSQGGKPSAVWCYVCRKRWDIFGLWREFNSEPNQGFTTTMLGLEKAFGLITPTAPDRSQNYVSVGPTEEEQEVLAKLEVCEKRLRLNKSKFQMKGYLTIGKILDNLHFQMKHGSVEIETAAKMVQAILDKIREKSA